MEDYKDFDLDLKITSQSEEYEDVASVITTTQEEMLSCGKEIQKKENIDDDIFSYNPRNSHKTITGYGLQ